MCQLQTLPYNQISGMCHNSLPSTHMQGVCHTSRASGMQNTTCAVWLLRCSELQMFRHRDCLHRHRTQAVSYIRNILLLRYCNIYIYIRNCSGVTILYKTLFMKLSRCLLIGKRETNNQPPSRQFKYTSMCSDP